MKNAEQPGRARRFVDSCRQDSEDAIEWCERWIGLQRWTGAALVRRAEEIRHLGAKARKQLPEGLVEQSGEELAIGSPDDDNADDAADDTNNHAKVDTD